MRGIYFVAAHKLILNVSKIRLRLICSRASYLPRLFSKGLRQKLFRTATDGGDSTQQQVFREKNLSLNSVHGRTLFNRLFSKALESKGYTIGNKTKLLGQPRRCCLASPPSMAVLYIQRTILNTHKYCTSFIKSPLIILSL